MAGSSSLHTPGCRPSLSEALPKTHHNQITSYTQQGNTISPLVHSTPRFLEIQAETDPGPTAAQLVTEAQQNPLFVATFTTSLLKSAHTWTLQIMGTTDWVDQNELTGTLE